MSMSLIHRRAERGLSLIELMVGLAVGLGVVVAALAATSTQARWHHDAATQARLLQDLHTASELIHRQLRRAGERAAGAVVGPAGAANPYTVLVVSAAGRQILLAASRNNVEDDVVGADETVALRLEAGVVELRVGQGGWQALTDATLIRVTELRFDVLTTAPVCGRPRGVRHVAWSLEAEALALPGVRRRIDGVTRVRHDAALPTACVAGA